MRHKISLNLFDDKGVTLVTVMGILVFVGLLAVVVVLTVTGELGFTKTTIRRKAAFEAAEAGIEYGMGEIKYTTQEYPATYDPADSTTWWLYIPQANEKIAFKSGRPYEPPQPIEGSELFVLSPGYSTEHVYNYYRIVASGKWEGKATLPAPPSKVHIRVLEAGAKVGPIPPGTGY